MYVCILLRKKEYTETKIIASKLINKFDQLLYLDSVVTVCGSKSIVKSSNPAA